MHPEETRPPNRIVFESMEIAERPATSIDPFSDAYLRDPYPDHERLRDNGPVTFLETYGVYAVARYADVVRVLADYETFCSSAGVGISDFRKNVPWRPPSLILEVDPPLHSRTHRVLLSVLSPDIVRLLRARFEAAAETLVDELLECGQVDAIADIARAFPLEVFPDAIGLRPDGRAHLLPYGRMVFNAFGPQNERFRDGMAGAEGIVRWIDASCERDALDPAGIGARVYDAVDAGEITYDEGRLLVRSILSAGLDTTVFGIGNTLASFARFPDQWRALREDPSRMRAAIDEAMRFESPVQAFFRTTTRAVEIDGVPLGEGEKILVFFGAANRDPRRWELPDVFDIGRRAGGHVAFGHGVHRCVGELFAKIESESLLGVLTRRVTHIVPTGKPELTLNNTLRGYASIPVRLVA